jgi:hypothetical protein
MNDTDLLRFLDTEQQAAYQHQNTNLSPDRVRATKEYMRTAYGNEEEGRSQVVSSEVFDCVEGMLPDLIEVFTSTDKAVQFDPIGPEDEQGAKQATQACNHVFYKQNNGFLVLYTAAKDALLLKVGAVKWYWDMRRTPTFQTYRAVDEMQLAAFIAANPTAEVIEQEPVAPTPGEEPGAPRFTVKIKTVEKRGTVRVVAIPPDELQVSRRHDSVLLDDCPYVAHVVHKTLSDIRQMGYDVSVDDVRAAQNEDDAEDRDLRVQGGNWGWWKQDDASVDDSMTRGWLREEYVLVDYDGDGIAERRKIVRLGRKILENYECSHVPIAAWTPYVLSHRFDGLSVADLVSDFQRIGTEVLRQQLDNLYLANNQETVVLTDAQGNPLANIDDLLNRRPGGIIRERASGAVRPYTERWQGIEAMPMLESLNAARENRTGFTRYSQGLDGESLNQTATGVNRIMDASAKRMKLMARLMAEALVAPLFLGIYKTLNDYCLDKLAFRVNGSFVEVDPQGWRDQYDMSIHVGIGTGDRAQQSAYLAQMAQSQAMVAQSPFAAQLLSPSNVYNLQARLAENAGFLNPGEFWTDPSTVPPPQPQPSPDQLKAQQSMAELQFKAQQDQQKFQADIQMRMQVDQNRQEYEARQKQLELQQQAELEQLKAQMAASLAEGKMAFEAEQREQDRMLQLQIERMKVLGSPEAFAAIQLDQDRALELQMERMRLFGTPETESGEVKQQQLLMTMASIVDKLTAPKRVVRDESGAVVGVVTE